MKRIIACVDDTSAATAITEHAIWAALQLAAPLEFLHVLDRHPETASVNDYSGSIGIDAQTHLLEELADKDTARSKLARERGRLLLESVKAQARAAGVAEADGRLRHGTLMDTLPELADAAELIVMGQHHHADKHGKLHLDHTLEGVIRSVRCPVLATREHFRVPEHMLIAFDGKTGARRTIERVLQQPMLRGLHCHVVMANHEQKSPEDKALEWACSTLVSGGFAVTTASFEGAPSKVMRDYASEHGIGLMVIGAYGHSALRQLIFGSTTTTLLRSSSVPVLTLR